MIQTAKAAVNLPERQTGTPAVKTYLIAYLLHSRTSLRHRSGLVEPHGRHALSANNGRHGAIGIPGGTGDRFLPHIWRRRGLFCGRAGIVGGRSGGATLNGAIFGFCAYATYDLTNQATLKNWSTALSLIDIGWGTALTAVSATLAVLAISAMGVRG